MLSTAKKMPVFFWCVDVAEDVGADARFEERVLLDDSGVEPSAKLMGFSSPAFEVFFQNPGHAHVITCIKRMKSTAELRNCRIASPRLDRQQRQNTRANTGAVTGPDQRV